MNLNRLKGSGLLIDGLDQFFVEWFGVERHPCSSLPPQCKHLPPDLRRFLEIVQHWPQLNLGDTGHDVVLFCHPPFFTGAIHDLFDFDFENPEREGALQQNYLRILAEHQGDFEFIYAVSGPRAGELLHNDTNCYSDQERSRLDFDRPETWKSVSSPLDEFLVSFTLWTVAKLFDNNRVGDISEIWCDSMISSHYLLFSNIDDKGWKNGRTTTTMILSGRRSELLPITGQYFVDQISPSTKT
jgi:hypothetical protein